MIRAVPPVVPLDRTLRNDDLAPRREQRVASRPGAPGPAPGTGSPSSGTPGSHSRRRHALRDRPRHRAGDGDASSKVTHSADPSCAAEPTPAVLRPRRPVNPALAVTEAKAGSDCDCRNLAHARRGTRRRLPAALLHQAARLRRRRPACLGEHRFDRSSQGLTVAGAVDVPGDSPGFPGACGSGVSGPASAPRCP